MESHVCWDEVVRHGLREVRGPALALRHAPGQVRDFRRERCLALGQDLRFAVYGTIFDSSLLLHCSAALIASCGFRDRIQCTYAMNSLKEPLLKALRRFSVLSKSKVKDLTSVNRTLAQRDKLSFSLRLRWVHLDRERRAGP